MPGKVKVKIISGRNLPVMDRSSDTTDAYVEIKLGSTTYKTDVCRKSLHPQWNTEWYRFEVDDSELQDEPLQIRLMDHDTYSANDAIGKVYLNLNPLLLPSASQLNKWNGDSRTRDNTSSNTTMMSGWLPVYDTMHGIRGEVDITVKVEHFSDFNKFRQSSCGTQFFCSPAVPHGFHAHTVHGFVEELIVNDDPEYQWIDKIRTPRASNEARQTLFCKLAGELQRKIGVKALDLGGNAVIGYRQSFDLEGESGIVARGIGTAITLVKIVQGHAIPGCTEEEFNVDELDGDVSLPMIPDVQEAPTTSSPPPTPPPATSLPYVPVSEPQPILHHQRSDSVGASAKVIPPPLQPSHSPAKLNSIHRRSSDSDLSVTSKGNSLTGSDRSGGYSSGHYMRANNALIPSTVPQENFDILEYPFLTMSQFPLGFIAFLGGAVNARSVKLLERITNLEEPESRDIWWSEIRMEIRSHARALNCNAVLGYKETTSICEEVCVLSASGTAAVIGYQCSNMINANDANFPSLVTTIPNTDNMTASLDRNDFEKERLISSSKPVDFSAPNTPQVKTTSESPDRDIIHPVLTSLPISQILSQGCSICHLPYKAKVAQLRNTTSKCSVCRSRKVPDVLIATIELPEGIPTQGRGCFLQSYVCRPLKDLKGESNAKEISDGLPFLEYELHRLLLNKLKVKGMNAIFGLNVRISIGERMLIGIATGTAVFLTPLPVPPIPKLRSTDEEKLAKLQRKLHETVKKNREIYQLINDLDNNRILSDDDSDDDRPAMDLNSGNKDCCVLEVDDPEDVTELNLLMEPRPPDGFHVVNTERVPGGLEDLEIVKNLQMFTQVWRSRVQPPYNFDRHFHRLLQTVYFKLRRMVPCALCHLQFRVESPEPDEIQLCVLGMALGLGDPQKNSKLKRKNFLQKRNDDDLIFNIEDDFIPENSTTVNTNYLHTTQNVKLRQKSPVRNKFATKQNHLPYKERHGVDITPLSYVPGGKIEKYLGNLNFFFIRETNSIREEGGLSGFMHSFITEVLAIVRSHVTALGGNAMVAYYLTECTLNHNLHKNQGQCLINVGGDVVFVTYYGDDH